MDKKDFDMFYPFFNEKENWGDIKKVKWQHVDHMVQVRLSMYTDHNWPIHINGSFAQSGHSRGSAHYHGVATDFYFITNSKNRNLLRQYEALKASLIDLKLWDFVDIGAYPEWRTPGFHFGSTGKGLKWVRIHGNYHYGEGELYKFLKP